MDGCIEMTRRSGVNPPTGYANDLMNPSPLASEGSSPPSMTSTGTERGNASVHHTLEVTASMKDTVPSRVIGSHSPTDSSAE